MNITYRTIGSFPRYRFGSDGTVWSCCVGGSGTRIGPWKIMKQHRRPDGYLFVSMSSPSGKYGHLVHRLILLAFVGPCPREQQALHANGIRSDNRIENLAWGTPSQNQADRIKHGTSNRGTQHGLSKLTDSLVRIIRAEYATGTYTCESLGKKHGIAKQTVCKVVNRQSWSHVA